MKNIAILVFSLLLTSALSAQQVINRSAIYDGEILELSGASSDLYAYSSSYSVDASGKVSAKVLSFHENGNLDEMGILLNGQKHGTWLRYDENGVKLNEANYSLGQKDGEWKVWDANGQLRMVYNFNEGKRAGDWLMYDEQGNLTEQKSF